MELRSMESWAAAMSGVDWRWIVAFVVVTYVINAQLSFMSKRKQLPGPTFVIPFLGNVFTMISDPHKFWTDQATIASKVS